MNKKKVLETAMDIINIDSRDKEHAEDEMVNYLSEIINNWGIKVKVISHEKNRKSLIFKISGKDSSKNILLCAHLDTVNIGAKDSDMDDSMKAKLKEGKIYGLGSSDMKSGIVIILYAIRDIIDKSIKLKNDLVVALTADEEYSRVGSHYLANESFVKNSRFVLIPEPTDLNLGIGQKGALWLELEFFGLPSHSSMLSKKGVSAIFLANKFINKIKEIDIGKKRTKYFSESPINIGYMISEGTINVVPARCKIGIDIRIAPPDENTLVLEKIRNILSENYKKKEYALRIIDNVSPTFVEPDKPLCVEIKKVIDKYAKSKDMIGLNYFSDGSIISNFTSAPVLILGPGKPELAHSIGEYVTIDNIFLGINIYKDIILSLNEPI